MTTSLFERADMGFTDNIIIPLQVYEVCFCASHAYPWVKRLGAYIDERPSLHQYSFHFSDLSQPLIYW